MWNLIAALIVTLFTVKAGTVYAGERDGAIMLSPFIGGYTFDGVERLETRPTFGLRPGYNFIKQIGVEGTFCYVSTCFTKPIPGTVDVFNYRLEGIYNFMSDRSLVPYLAIGGGGATIITPSNISISHTYNHSPTVNVGSGIKWFLNQDIAIRADYHQNFLINTSDGNNKVQDSMLNYEYSLGLQIIFGGT
jgi:OOP family OmpA-OmpF porin